MSRKDYISLAAIFKHHITFPGYDRTTVESIAQDIATTLRADNPRFDRERFLRACGIQS